MENKSFKTWDTTFAAWLEKKKKLPVIPQRKVNGRASFIVVGITEEQGAKLRLEYEETDIYDIDLRRRDMIHRIPGD